MTKPILVIYLIAVVLMGHLTWLKLTRIAEQKPTDTPIWTSEQKPTDKPTGVFSSPMPADPTPYRICVFTDSDGVLTCTAPDKPGIGTCVTISGGATACIGPK